MTADTATRIVLTLQSLYNFTHKLCPTLAPVEVLVSITKVGTILNVSCVITHGTPLLARGLIILEHWLECGHHKNWKPDYRVPPLCIFSWPPCHSACSDYHAMTSLVQDLVLPITVMWLYGCRYFKVR